MSNPHSREGLVPSSCSTIPPLLRSAVRALNVCARTKWVGSMLAAQVFGEHDDRFKNLNSQLLRECAGFDWTGGAGHAAVSGRRAGCTCCDNAEAPLSHARGSSRVTCLPGYGLSCLRRHITSMDPAQVWLPLKHMHTSGLRLKSSKGCSGLLVPSSCRLTVL